MKTTSLILLALTLAVGAGAAEGDIFVIADGDTVWLTDPIIILGSRVPAALPGLTRPVAVTGPEAGAPVRSTAELLATLPAVDVSQRRQYGTQADLSVRGSTFEQVQVLLDGWDVGDAQTGHHALDLPLGLADVARLEVLRGHGSALYGANAFGGVVNVIPRTPSWRRGGALALGGGDFETRFARLRLESGAGEVLGLDGRAWISGGWFRTDGDREHTDAENGSVSLRAMAETGWCEVEVLSGYASRDFGALDFYAPYPSHEKTETAFTGFKLRADLSDAVVLEQRLSGRRHRDRFTLFGDDPDIYFNDHVTRRAAAETRLLVEAGYGLAVAVGVDGMYEDIRSNGIRGGVAGPALGDHERRRVSGSFELSGRHAPLRWSLGTRLDGWSIEEPRLSRSASASLDLDDGVLLRASAGTVFRVPTFTELFYVDPANVGDPDLSPEHGWSWDAGAEVRRGPWTVVWEVFVRHETDLIDWARPGDAAGDPWRVMNIAEGEVRGLTSSYHLDTPRGDVFYLHHTYLDKTRALPTDHVAKYAFLAPRHLVSAGVTVNCGRVLRLTPQARLRERSDGVGHIVTDLRAAFTVEAWSIDVTATNVFDRDYQEIPDVLMPGRLVTATLAYLF
jgi:outer membrane cobalamin receptor